MSSFKFAGRLLRRCVRPYRTLQIPWPRPARHPRGRPAHPAREAPAAPPARHRSPAEPAPRLEFFPAKKKSSCPVGGQLSKVSANLPGRAAPARRHGGHAADDVSYHQLRSSVRFCRPLAPSCAGLAFDRRNRSNQIESHPKKKPWCGPSLQREVLVNFAEEAQTVSSFKFAGRVLRWRSPENLQILTV